MVEDGSRRRTDYGWEKRIEEEDGSWLGVEDRGGQIMVGRRRSRKRTDHGWVKRIKEDHGWVKSIEDEGKERTT